MKQIIKDLCPPLVWRTLQDIRSQIRPHQIKTKGDSQDLDLYWTPEMAQVLETWADGNAWLEVQFLMANCKGRVLDIACGTGKTMTLLDPEILEVYGCDISDLLISKAVERGLPQARLKVCDATQLPYADCEFSYSYSIGSLEHFTEDGIGKFIAEAARVSGIGSFHMMPTSRSGRDEGWMKTYQSFHNCSPSWWMSRFEKHFARVRVLIQTGMIAFPLVNGSSAIIEMNTFLLTVYRILNTPRRLREKLCCARLRGICELGAGAQLTAEAIIHNASEREAVQIGANTLFMGEIVTILSGAVRIGDCSYVGPGAKLWSLDAIDIGSRVFISHGVQIFDNNSHSLSASERHDRFMELRKHGRHLVPEAVAHKPICIEDDVWIGFNAAILKGVTIGRGAVVGACAVVTHDVPPYAVMVGNPARQVGESRP